MITLNGLSATPFQKLQVPINDNVIDMTLIYRPSVQMWFLDLLYQDIDIRGMRICHNLNLLAQYENILKFGLYVQVDDVTEPGLIDDFSTGRVILNILDESEIESIKSGYSSLK